MVCPHGQGGMNQFGHFSDKGGESQFFTILFVRMYFIDDPLVLLILLFLGQTTSILH